MRMHMLRVISIDPLFPDDNRHTGIAANDAECGPILIGPVNCPDLLLVPNVSGASNPGDAHSRIGQTSTQDDDYCLGGYAGI